MILSNPRFERRPNRQSSGKKNRPALSTRVKPSFGGMRVIGDPLLPGINIESGPGR